MHFLKAALFPCCILLTLLLTACGGGSSADNLNMLADSARYPKAGTDGDGNVLAVWAQPGGYFAAAYRVDAGWEPPQKIGDVETTGENFLFATGTGGHALAAWENPASRYDVHVVRYAPGSGWGDVEVLEGVGEPKDVVVDVAGNAVLVSIPPVTDFIGMTLSHYTMGTGWSHSDIPAVTPSAFRGYPRLSLGPSDHAHLLWTEYDSGAGISAVYVRRHTGSDWDDPVQIASLSGLSINAVPHFKFDHAGNAIALWTQWNSSTEIGHLYACRYSVATGWNPPVQIDTFEDSVWSPYLAVGPSRDFFAIWVQTQIYSSRYVADVGWQPPQVVGSASWGVEQPQIVVDADGNAFAAWNRRDKAEGSIYDAPGPPKVCVNRFLNGTGWGTEQLLAQPPGSSDGPVPVMDPLGSPMVLWSQRTDGDSGLSGFPYSTFFYRFE